MRHGLAQWGLELRGPSWSTALPGRSRLVFGADFDSFAVRKWNVTTSLTGGLEWANDGRTRRIDVLLAYLRGFMPFSQFFSTEKIENFGVDLQFEF